MNWGAEDFIAAALLLLGAGLAYRLIARRARSRGQRIAVALAVLAALVLVWVELAVGLFD